MSANDLLARVYRTDVEVAAKLHPLLLEEEARRLLDESTCGLFEGTLPGENCGRQELVKMAEGILRQRQELAEAASRVNDERTELRDLNIALLTRLRSLSSTSTLANEDRGFAAFSARTLWLPQELVRGFLHRESIERSEIEETLAKEERLVKELRQKVAAMESKYQQAKDELKRFLPPEKPSLAPTGPSSGEEDKDSLKVRTPKKSKEITHIGGDISPIISQQIVEAHIQQKLTRQLEEMKETRRDSSLLNQSQVIVLHDESTSNALDTSFRSVAIKPPSQDPTPSRRGHVRTPSGVGMNAKPPIANGPNNVRPKPLLTPKAQPGPKGPTPLPPPGMKKSSSQKGGVDFSSNKKLADKAEAASRKLSGHGEISHIADNNMSQMSIATIGAVSYTHLTLPTIYSV
eukprot:TRINITY_DN7459_c0_g2_i2.p1 TRINITY_DN7459_c0_g2~~TRINITY_DN7459_c0_g2_i2.p1  ORF type:complete len:405 (-),score=76.55 TRINITY_DN7459_c0_g2_i2:37-1251(-)